ncbi:uncharacterized protein K02A2.6-like [Uranotaenia lowii]|uniref:uncharacterized protein K02A2.6-like n=1 Tax=Uranotaenia lowii TaxID=190385 RepID=UPI0024799A32|nr:uncharacterized protein K02A2.6-like [Uranotaenia lowii]
MLLNLQRYSIEIHFVTGKDNVVADAISRAPYNSDSEADSFNKGRIFQVFKQVEDCKLTSYLSISDQCLGSVMEATQQDFTLNSVRDYIFNGWPKNIKLVHDAVKLYYKYRNELSTQDGLVFRNDRLVIPKSLQRTMIDRVHISHNGIESTLKLARENIFWPGMSAMITDVVKDCAVCAKFSSSQQKPPMQSHAVPIYPFQVVSLDIFFADFRGRKRNFLVTVDHYSDFIELNLLKDMSARTLIETCQMNFARYGIPQQIVSDNGTNLVNEEMRNFAKAWNFEHTTSAPNHQQANGKAEAAVKIMKRLIQKCEETGENLWYSVLHWRNTPNKIGSSPVNRLFSRSTRCGVPASVEKYFPKVVDHVPEAILENGKKAKYYYDRKARELPTFEAGSPVYVQLHPEMNKTWTPAVVKHKLNERSYLLNTNGGCYRRDLVNIKPRNEPEVSAQINDHPTIQPKSHHDDVVDPGLTVSGDQSVAELPSLPTPEASRIETPSTTKTHDRRASSSAMETSTESPKADRPRRERRLPFKFRDYVIEKDSF